MVPQFVFFSFSQSQPNFFRELSIFTIFHFQTSHPLPRVHHNLAAITNTILKLLLLRSLPISLLLNPTDTLLLPHTQPLCYYLTLLISFSLKLPCTLASMINSTLVLFLTLWPFFLNLLYSSLFPCA